MRSVVGSGTDYRGSVPLVVLPRAEIRRVKNLLQTQNLYALLAGSVNKRQVFLHHRFHDFFNAALADP